MRASRLLLSILLGVAMVPSAVTPLRAGEDPFVHDGFSGLHPMQSGPMADHIDPLSDNLNIVTTDLVLPGNAGFNLAITRWYSSQTTPGYPNDFWVEDSWEGVGWQLHFGRVLHLDKTTPGATMVELPLGAGGPLYRTSK